MKKEFTLSNGQQGIIEIDDMLIDIMGDEWVKDKIKSLIADREKEVSKSQE